MKSMKFGAACLLAIGLGQLDAGEAQAARLTGDDIQTLLVSRYACGSNGNETWDERLLGTGSGDVEDYKKGPTDPVDKTEVVGTYSIDKTNHKITYNYGSGGIFTYQISNSGATVTTGPGTYTFTGAPGPTLTITVSDTHCQ